MSEREPYSYSRYFTETTMSDKNVETLRRKIRFSIVFETLPPPPRFFSPNQTVLIFLFIRLHRLQRLNNIELGPGPANIRELTLDAGTIEQEAKYRKASFSKGVSATYVAYCSLRLRLMRGVFSNANNINLF